MIRVEEARQLEEKLDLQPVPLKLWHWGLLGFAAYFVVVGTWKEIINVIASIVGLIL